MPKEVIQGRHENFGVHIGWTPDKVVQIGLVLKDPETSTAQQNLRDLVNSEDWEEEWMGIFSTLSREEINRLIRVLRRARDSAYGRDE